MTPKNEIFTVTIDSIIAQFQKIEDHRMQNKVDHLLIDILVISVCAIIASADGPKAIAEWAKSNLRRQFIVDKAICDHDHEAGFGEREHCLEATPCGVEL